MNKIMLVGRATRDPEIRYSQGEKSTCVASFSIAVDRRGAADGAETADFFDCVSFGRLAEVFEKHVKKGTKMLIVGRLQNDNYTNKDGVKVYRNRVIVDEFEFAESKKE